MAIKELLIDTTFDLPLFSSDCTFKIGIAVKIRTAGNIGIVRKDIIRSNIQRATVHRAG
jgi:hypothetical protein